jgi:hypothetical protein
VSGGMGGNVGAVARGGNVAAFNGGNFNGGNNVSFREGSRMGRMDHDHDRDHRGRFRGQRFAFGFGVPDYYDYDYNYYDDGCYQLREVPTRHGWRWLRVWVCD